MHRIAAILACVCIASLTLADEPLTLAEEMKRFTGSWEIAAVRPEGVTKDARRLVFNRDGTYAAHDKEGNELWSGTFEIDPAGDPKVWDHRSHEARQEGRDALGIYELDGDRLKLACVVGQWKDNQWVGKPRPQAFDLKQADVVIELRRVKPTR